jgi:hypothetical protein
MHTVVGGHGSDALLTWKYEQEAKRSRDQVPCRTQRKKRPRKNRPSSRPEWLSETTPTQCAR